eukprot:Pgem_evm1s12346
MTKLLREQYLESNTVWGGAPAQFYRRKPQNYKKEDKINPVISAQFYDSKQKQNNTENLNGCLET